PAPSWISVSTTMTERPTRSGRAVAIAWPSRRARRKFVVEEIVAVPGPGGRLRKAQTPPRLSANAINAPPWSRPPVVQRSSRQARRPLTSSGAAAVSSMPSPAANGIMAMRSPSSGMPPTLGASGAPGRPDLARGSAAPARIVMAQAPNAYGRAPQAPYGHGNGSARRPQATRRLERRRGGRADVALAAAAGEPRGCDHPPGPFVAGGGG